MFDESPQTSMRLRRFRDGSTEALSDAFEHYRERLRRFVSLRLDRRLAARVDASDVLQEVFLDASRQIDSYLREPKVCFFVWLRGLTGERIQKLERAHLGAIASQLRTSGTGPRHL